MPSDSGVPRSEKPNENMMDITSHPVKASGYYPAPDEDLQQTQETAEALAVNTDFAAIAVRYARLLAESRRQQAAIQAAAGTIPAPLLILDEQGNILVSNEATRELLSSNMSQLFAGIGRSVGNTTEIKIDDNTYLATSQHLAEVGTIIVMQDITYVKQLEQDRAEILHTLSHDLKSPLTSIMGYAELLGESMNLDKKGERFVKQIAFAAERMREMISLLLQATHVEALTLDETVVDMYSLIEDVIRNVDGAALNKSIDLALDSLGAPYLILGDPMRLYHMILNLVDNAVKYSLPESVVKIILNYSQQALTIEVQDEGPGISDDDLPHIFKKFYRGTHSSTQQGNGVGLSVVAAVAAAHDGDATAYNLPEGGAAFKVRLPGHMRMKGQPPAGKPSYFSRANVDRED